MDDSLVRVLLLAKENSLAKGFNSGIVVVVLVFCSINVKKSSCGLSESISWTKEEDAGGRGIWSDSKRIIKN